MGLWAYSYGYTTHEAMAKFSKRIVPMDNVNKITTEFDDLFFQKIVSTKYSIRLR